jgi:hypothetical protein
MGFAALRTKRLIYLNKSRILSFRDASPFEASPRLQVSTMSQWFSWTPALLPLTVSRRLDFRVFFRRSGSCRYLGIATWFHTQLPWVSPSTVALDSSRPSRPRPGGHGEARRLVYVLPRRSRAWFRISGASSSSCRLTTLELLSMSQSRRFSEEFFFVVPSTRTALVEA